MYDFKLARVLGVVCVLLLCGSVVACGGAEDDTGPEVEVATSALEEGECEPAEGYEWCDSIAVDDIVSWRESLSLHDGAPPWRVVENTGEAIEVVLKPDKFNLGLVPTPENEGVYDSTEEFREAASEFLGFDVSTAIEAGIPVHIIQTTPSTKMRFGADGSVESLDVSTGEFLFDALSSVDGVIYVDGEAYTLEPDEVLEEDDESVPMVIRSTMPPPSMCHIRVAAGEWHACLSGGYRAPFSWWPFPKWFGKTHAFNGKRYYDNSDGTRTVAHAALADKMELEVYYFDDDGGFGRDSDTKYNAERISFARYNSFWFNTTYIANCGETRITHNGTRDRRSGYLNRSGNPVGFGRCADGNID